MLKIFSTKTINPLTARAKIQLIHKLIDCFLNDGQISYIFCMLFPYTHTIMVCQSIFILMIFKFDKTLYLLTKRPRAVLEVKGLITARVRRKSISRYSVVVGCGGGGGGNLLLRVNE